MLSQYLAISHSRSSFLIDAYNYVGKKTKIESNEKYDYKTYFKEDISEKIVSQKRLMKSTLELLGLAQKEGTFLKDN